MSKEDKPQVARPRTDTEATAAKKVKKEPKKPRNVGEGTIMDHEKRITNLENELGIE